jgi:SIR2-like domain
VIPRSDLTSLSHEAATSPLVFLVGSGVSIPYPAALPSARQMVSLVLSGLAPDDATVADKEAIGAALPELFYEGLYGLIGEAAVRPWTVLDLHRTDPSPFSHSVGPTPGHLIVTYLSWRNGLPILTTNFDTFFETAATLLGVSPLVSLPISQSGWQLSTPAGPQVAIWKIHGSSDNPISICTTLKQIATFNDPLLTQVRHLVHHFRPCLLGYSGRDIDFFPFLANFPFYRSLPAYWLCRDFPPWHAIHSAPSRFIGLSGAIDSFATATLGHISNTSAHHSRLLSALRTADISPVTSDRRRAETLNVYTDRVATMVQNELRPLLVTTHSDNRRLLLALSLANIHRFRDAARSAEIYLAQKGAGISPEAGVKAQLLLATSYHNLAAYRQSEMAARKALSVATEHSLHADRLAALAALDEAARMRLDLPLALGLSPLDSRIRLSLLAVRFLVDWGRLVWWGRSLNPLSSPDPAILEHRVRVFAILQSLLRRSLRLPLIRWLLARQWQGLYADCYRVGYAAGVANALKYLRRLPGAHVPATAPLSDPLHVVSSRHVYDLINHKTGLALTLRDDGDIALAQGHTHQASQLYSEAASMASDLGNASLELKALLGLTRCGQSHDPAQVAELIDRIQCDHHALLRRAVLLRLTG